ncbi:MAG TPA: hypothetical protein VEB21_17105 [Terriglobales bacterium]|nr:hypothetical protein [Terriglobales bacterium]
MRNRWLFVAILAALCGLPLAASAQEAVVITAPLAVGVGAPAVGFPMLATLAVLLAAAALYALRKKSARSLAMLIGLALSGAVAIAYAGGGVITLQGPDCSERAIHPYNPSSFNTLRNECTNPMQVVEIEVDCSDEVPEGSSVPLPLCTEGMVLNNGQECTLPGCLT